MDLLTFELAEAYVREKKISLSISLIEDNILLINSSADIGRRDAASCRVESLYYKTLARLHGLNGDEWHKNASLAKAQWLEERAAFLDPIEEEERVALKKQREELLYKP